MSCKIGHGEVCMSLVRLHGQVGHAPNKRHAHLEVHVSMHLQAMLEMHMQAHMHVHDHGNLHDHAMGMVM